MQVGDTGPGEAAETPNHVPVVIADEPTALYRFYDAAGVLLYVGISRNPVARWAQHATDKAWWPQVRKKTVELFGSRREAEIAEGRAIRSESPLHNLAPGRADPEARPPVRRLPAILRKPGGPRKPAEERISLVPFIQDCAARRKCTYDEAANYLIMQGVIQDYIDRFADPREGLGALTADMIARGATPPEPSPSIPLRCCCHRLRLVPVIVGAVLVVLDAIVRVLLAHKPQRAEEDDGDGGDDEDVGPQWQHGTRTDQ